MNGGKSNNETLFLVKYVFFPHTLRQVGATRVT
jgi:hypothetical protein